MKKTVKSIIGSVIVVIAMSANFVGAQEKGGGGGGGGGETQISSPVPATPTPVVIPAQLPFIASQDALREYALAQVVRGSRSIEANSIDWSFNENFTSVEAFGNGAEDVLNKLFSFDFKYRLTNPDDKITGSVWLSDSSGQTIFYGRADYAAAKEVKPQYGIWMQHIPILSGVRSAEVLAIGEDGTTANRIPLEVNRHGQVLFGSWLAGAVNGILSAKFSDGQVATYKLSSPTSQMVGASTEADSSWKIDSHYVYPLSEKPKVVKIIETWNRPTVLIDVAVGEVVTFDVTGIVQMNGVTSFERPAAMIFTDQDGRMNGAKLSGETTQIDFPTAGQYRIRFDWVNFGQPGTLYTGPQDDGHGKG
ncbi:MAG: hypothetical protein Q8Q03_00505 [bacterium]|nr:hypothetical protein [bacterium]